MKPIHIPPLTENQRTELEHLYRTTKLPWLRTHAQMVLLSGEQALKVTEIAAIVRESDDTVARRLKRYLAEAKGLKG